MPRAADPEFAQGIADYIAATRAGGAGQARSLEESRLIADRNAAAIAIPRPPGMTVSNSFVVSAGRETPVRIYRPNAKTRAALVYFHGGGFTTGSIETYDPLATALAEACDAVVISVGYRRLPEATPRAIYAEAAAAMAWAVENAETLSVSPARIGVAGDSAGALIAAQLAIAAGQWSVPKPCCQLLAYAMVDIDDTLDRYRDSADPILTMPVMEAIIRTFRACDGKDPGPEMPLRLTDPGNQPPAVMIAAEHDPLLAEDLAYEALLRECGVETKLRIAPAMPHGFLRAVRFSNAARDEMKWLGDSARRYLHAS